MPSGCMCECLRGYNTYCIARKNLNIGYRCVTCYILTKCNNMITIFLRFSSQYSLTVTDNRLVH